MPSTSAAAAPAPAAGMPAVTPEMARLGAEMMAKMNPEDVARMRQLAQGMGGVPPSPDAIPPEMAKLAGEMVAKMSPEDVARMEASGRRYFVSCCSLAVLVLRSS